jgi:hypothetical protein
LIKLGVDPSVVVSVEAVEGNGEVFLNTSCESAFVDLRSGLELVVVLEILRDEGSLKRMASRTTEGHSVFKQKILTRKLSSRAAIFVITVFRYSLHHALGGSNYKLETKYGKNTSSTQQS